MGRNVQLTNVNGSAVVRMVRQELARLRDIGNRVTRGGFRQMAKRMGLKLLRTGANQPLLKAAAHHLLRPLPGLSERLYRATAAPAEKLTTTRFSRIVSSFYQTAFGQPPEPNVLAGGVAELQSGMSVELFSQRLVQSREFGLRHGTSDEISERFVTTLYRDGLGRQPEFEALKFWLAEGKKGASRAKILAGIACSEEALTIVDSYLGDEYSAYNRWVQANDSINELDRLSIRTHIAVLPCTPVISVIAPVSRYSESTLLESFNSVISQIYPYWELCLVFDTAAGPRASRSLRESVARDSRIRLAELSTSSGTVSLANAGLKMATGDFVAFLYNGDRLPEHALYEAAFALGRGERPDIVYSDHDFLDTQGLRSNPWFKPGWDPDLILSQDYLSSGLAVYRRSLVERIGLLRPDFEGAEFHDLALRATAVTSPERISHIPAILLHRRQKNPLICSNDAAQLFAINASRRAVRDCLDARGDSGAHIDQIQSVLHVTWPLPKPEPLISIIVPTRDRVDLLEQCVEGVLHQTDYSNLELVIVDNESAEDATLKFFERLCREDKRARILQYPGPFNYSAMNNAAAREAGGEILLLLNNDIRVIDRHWLREMASQALRPDVGIVGAKLYYANQELQHGGVVLGPHGHMVHLHRYADMSDPGYFGQLAHARTLSAVTCACAAIRRSVFFEVGGFDETNLPIAFNDVDLSLRLGDYGYRVVWTPFAELFHLESASRGKEDADPIRRERFLQEWQHMRRKWGLMLESADPFHNPNLLFHPYYFQVPSAPRREKPWRRLSFELSDMQAYSPANEHSLNLLQLS